MRTIVRNISAVMIGLFIGSAANMCLLMLGSHVIPAPEGVDVTSMQGLEETIHLFEPKHFVFPFLAHAFGTLVGALLATKIAGSRKFSMAMTIGVVFLAGGAVNVFMLPAPAWFNALDLIAAYLPMAWIGGRLMSKSAPNTASGSPNI